MTSINAIEVKNVSFTYKNSRKALDSVSFVVPEKQIVGLLGPNGGGKTTLFKIISTLIRKYDGEIEVNGQNQKHHLQNVLRNIGVVFQSPSLDKKLTIEENLIYHGHLYGLSTSSIRSRMDRLLDSLSIRDRMKEKVDQLSGGLARRAEIVKSLLHSPKILILDEPSTGLDMGGRLELWKLLKKVQELESVTILLTTHFIEEGDRCDDLVLLHEGKVVCSGPPVQLKQKLTQKFFRLKPKNLLDMQNKLSEKYHIKSTAENELLLFQVEAERVHELIQELSSQVDELTYREPSLEDVFLFHTGHRFMEGSL